MVLYGTGSRVLKLLLVVVITSQAAQVLAEGTTQSEVYDVSEDDQRANSTNCEDINTKCPKWAGQGKCNKGHVFWKCKSSCACGSDSIPCEDTNIKCPKWASQGKCDTARVFKKCKSSCSCESAKGCFKVGTQSFLKTTHNTTSWIEASEICAKNHGQGLAEPQDPQALSEYLADNYDDTSYWIGAYGTHNDSAVFVSGGLIGSEAPWFANWYASCDDPHWCMYLLANEACYNSNQCLGCWVCNPNPDGNQWGFRTPLCTCNIRS